ncbi:MAG: GTPase ObgE [Candidatus Pacebacteria bacterium]|nr:GTPase ObgE [Candidatus Paceibacterota bacterium]
MLIDDVKINITAGKGGDGSVYFNKNKREQGPTGGDGGRGGSVYVVGVSDIGALKFFRFQKKIKAEEGKKGGTYFKHGVSGKDIYLNVPVGTVICDLKKKTTKEVKKIGEEVLVARGGRGGRGNFQFRSSTNTTPREFEYGREGEQVRVRLELKMIADVGLIGLPNVGKSSLINELTRAKSKVANYSFTTLEPSLGAYYELVLADIPGLIEGASEGKGLGVKFLRHVERTKVLFHLISASSATPTNDYLVIRRELENHNPLLVEKKEYIIISKKDEVSEGRIEKIKKELKRKNKDVVAVSILEEESLKEVKKILGDLIKEKKE